MRDRFVASFTRLAADDSDLMLLTGDLGFGVLTEFAEQFPRQYLNVGVAEQNLTSIAAGLAMAGKRVFTYSIANFPTLRCLEQIRNDICYHGLPVTIVSIGGGLSYGSLGFSHHATEDIAIMRALPNMTVVAPGDDDEAEAATAELVAHDGPAYLRLDRAAPRPAGSSAAPFRLGRMRLVREAGDTVLLLSTGAMLATTLQAADRLVDRGIGVTIASCHTLKPFDTDTLAGLLERKYRIIATVEEHSVIGGLGSAVAEAITEPTWSSTVPVLRIGLPDVLPTVVGSQQYLRAEYGLTADEIANSVVCAVKAQDPVR